MKTIATLTLGGVLFALTILFNIVSAHSPIEDAYEFEHMMSDYYQQEYERQFALCPFLTYVKFTICLRNKNYQSQKLPSILLY